MFDRDLNGQLSSKSFSPKIFTGLVCFLIRINMETDQLYLYLIKLIEVDSVTFLFWTVFFFFLLYSSSSFLDLTFCTL